EKTLICSSGMAAISTVLLSLLKSGDHVVMSKAIYGETIELVQMIITGFGIEVTFADFTDPEEVKKAVKENTKMFYTEIIANPLTLVTDLDVIAAIAGENNILTIVDSTFTTPFVFRPLEHGADLVLHSMTKYFGGHSDITGGCITASTELIDRIYPKYLLLGCCLDPVSSWMTLRSVKTMSMRVRAQNQNAIKIAQALAQDPHVKAVYHPSLPEHPHHELASKLFDTDYGYGAMLSFCLEDDHEKVAKFMKSLKLICYLGTLGGIRTTFTHPRTAFVNNFSDEELDNMGLAEGLIRISVGAEDSRDLIEDLTQALAAMDD
ncbi:MAG: aminotransferase class I/II-fold pyridoxal phosphate-dependent enzyme, partial [Eubacteriaceae bacterium]|nr:aminotransferase class I/II-fold pyridoxal phosphate-dependent enzyme [Eubacteriaceae bacterium]